MILTYLLLKLTFEGILAESNRLALEEEKRERAGLLKSRLLQLRMDYEARKIGEEEYNQGVGEILKGLEQLTQVTVQGGA